MPLALALRAVCRVVGGIGIQGKWMVGGLIVSVVELSGWRRLGGWLEGGGVR